MSSRYFDPTPRVRPLFQQPHIKARGLP